MAVINFLKKLHISEVPKTEISTLSVTANQKILYPSFSAFFKGAITNKMCYNLLYRTKFIFKNSNFKLRLYEC